MPVITRLTAPIARLKHMALANVPISGAIPDFSLSPELKTNRFSSFDEFQAWQEESALLVAEWEDEDTAAEELGLTSESDSFVVPGVCAICNGDRVGFVARKSVVKRNSAGEQIPNWREMLVCPQCRIGNRVRAALQIGIQELGITSDSRIYLTEQLGVLYRWMRGRFSHLSGSEYISPNKVSGTRVIGINHQDVQALSFGPASVDAVITFDVMEHVPDPNSAFREFARILSPGGRLIMTAPFTVNKYETTVRAVMQSDGSIKHLLPIEIHGDPLDPNGTLCFRHFGWDVLEQLRDAGFRDTEVIVYHSRELGHLGGIQSLITARLP